MKKTISILFIFLMLPLAFAQQGQQNNNQQVNMHEFQTNCNAALLTPDKCCKDLDWDSFNEEKQICVMDKYKVRERVQFNITGLFNAQLRVRNEESVQHLQEVIEKIQEQSLLRLQKLNNLEFDMQNNKTIAEGTKQAKLFNLFKLRHKYQYEISSTGDAIRQKRWSDIFFVDIDEENNTEQLQYACKANGDYGAQQEEIEMFCDKATTEDDCTTGDELEFCKWEEVV